MHIVNRRIQCRHKSSSSGSSSSGRKRGRRQTQGVEGNSRHRDRIDSRQTGRHRAGRSHVSHMCPRLPAATGVNRHVFTCVSQSSRVWPAVLGMLMRECSWALPLRELTTMQPTACQRDTIRS